MPIPIPVSGSSFKQLTVAIVGGGLGGLASAVALRRAGHIVHIYERRGFDVEVGASISCAANGTQWLREWEVDITTGKPVILMNLTMRDWKTGKILNDYSLKDYEKTWGNVYNMFHRQDMHAMLLEAAIGPGKGIPATIVIDHVAETVDVEKGSVTFKNGRTITADLIIGSDGIRSVVRTAIGIVPKLKSAPQTCYRCNVKVAEIKRLGLVDYAYDPSIQFWGGMPPTPEDDPERSQYYKVVMSPCQDAKIVSFYLFMPTEMTNHTEEGFSFAEAPVSDLLAGKFSTLDPDCRALIENSVDRMPWRLYIHEPYDYWFKGKAAILGDAAHPMMPHQSQGACMAIEDAAALGIIFSDNYPQFTQDPEAGLAVYQNIRQSRATRVQDSSRRALDNLNERIGFSSLTPHDAALAAADGKLTVNEMNSYDMHAHIAEEVAKINATKIR